MKQLAICLLLILVACGSNSAVMTGESFQKIHTGMSEEALVKSYGKPLTIYHKDNGDVVYEYIERFQMGNANNNTVEARKYYFTIRNHKIISKQMVVTNASAYDPMNQL